MFKKLSLTLALAGLATTSVVAIPQVAQAQRYHHHGSYHRHYRGCGGGNGAVGTVAGGVGGALVGRHFDKQHTRRHNGC